MNTTKRKAAKYIIRRLPLPMVLYLWLLTLSLLLSLSHSLSRCSPKTLFGHRILLKDMVLIKYVHVMNSQRVKGQRKEIFTTKFCFCPTATSFQDITQRYPQISQKNLSRSNKKLLVLKLFSLFDYVLL